MSANNGTTPQKDPHTECVNKVRRPRSARAVLSEKSAFLFLFLKVFYPSPHAPHPAHPPSYARSCDRTKPTLRNSTYTEYISVFLWGSVLPTAMLWTTFGRFVAVVQGTMKKIEDFKNRKTDRKGFGGTTGVYYYAILIDFRVPWGTPT